MGVDPTDLFGRVADHEGIRRYIFGDDGTGTDETVLAERVTAHDSRVRADGCTSFDDRLAVLILAADRSTRVDDIGEDHRRTEEHIIFATHTGIDGDVVLDLTVTTEHHIRRDHHVLTDITVLTDDAAFHNMTKMPDLGSFADLATFVHVGRLMYKNIFHYHLSFIINIVCVLLAKIP